MVGILIISHGSLGESLVHCAEHIMGRTVVNLAQISVSKADDPVEVVSRARALAEKLDHGDGVLVLTDIYGGTPSNIACKLIEPGRIDGISGVSLPMLVRALTYSDQGLTMVVDKAISGGCQGVVHLLNGAGDVAAGR